MEKSKNNNKTEKKEKQFIEHAIMAVKNFLIKNIYYYENTFVRKFMFGNMK